MGYFTSFVFFSSLHKPQLLKNLQLYPTLNTQKTLQEQINKQKKKIENTKQLARYPYEYLFLFQA